MAELSSQTATNMLNDPSAEKEVSVVRADDLPGPMSLHHLRRCGMLTEINSDMYYVTEDGETTFGRAKVIADLLGEGEHVCGVTAAWIWVGGVLPWTLEIWKGKSGRAEVAGRPLHRVVRAIPDDQFVEIGSLKVTTPERTLCDLALKAPEEVATTSHVAVLAISMMKRFNINLEHCLGILHGQSYMHHSTTAPDMLSQFGLVGPNEFTTGA